MARPLRIAFPGAFYHVTARGNERKAIFKSKRDRERFLQYLETATDRYQAVIHAFCLMNNHYHLLLETPAGNLSQIMHHVNGAYTTYFNVKRARNGHLFQGRYKAILVEKNEFISSKKSNRNVPALKQLANQATIPDICQAVESVFGGTPRLSRKVKIFLCRKHTTASLAVIGDRFGIGDSAVAQSYSRFLNEINTDRRLRRQVDKIEKMITM